MFLSPNNNKKKKKQTNAACYGERKKYNHERPHERPQDACIANVSSVAENRSGGGGGHCKVPLLLLSLVDTALLIYIYILHIWL